MTALLTPPDLVDELEKQAKQSREAVVEDVDDKRGTILVRAVPYDHEIELYDGVFESFGQGAFARAADAPHRVKLRNRHKGPTVGVGAVVEDRPDGSWIEFKFANTLDGQEARELARDKILDQVSVTFRPMRDWYRVTTLDDGVHIHHKRAHLWDVSLVDHGAYGEAAYIAEVRAAEAELANARALTSDAAERAAQEKAERRARLLKLNH